MTGFCIPSAEPPAAETDGPPGAICLARTLLELGHDAVLISDDYGKPVLEAGCDAIGLPRSMIRTIPLEADGSIQTDCWVSEFFQSPLGSRLTHLIAIERAGPSHTIESAADPEFAACVGPEDRDVCHTMRGVSIEAYTAKAHRLFEVAAAQPQSITTVGIADGGNEIGCGAIPWYTLRHAIAGDCGDRIACRIPCEHLLIGGVSDWAAYALVVGIGWLAGKRFSSAVEIDAQRKVLEAIVRDGGAVDGISRLRKPTVDSLPAELYLSVFDEMLQSACG